MAVVERCPQCNGRLDLRLDPMEFQNDDTAEEKTVAFDVQSQICTNPECYKNNQVINKIMHRRE